MPNNRRIKPLSKRPGGLSIAGRERIVSILSPIALLFIWQALSWAGVIDLRFISSPISIGQTAIKLIASGDLVENVQTSLTRLMIGFTIGAIVGVIIGIVMGLSRWVRAAIDPIVSAIYPIPKIALLPLIMIYFGIGESSKVFIIAFSVVFIVLINTMAGVLSLDPIFFDVAKNYGVSWRKLFFRVVLPGTLPMIFVGLRLAIGVALIMIVAAEFVAAQSGIGYMIWSSFQTMRVDDMFVGIIIITLLGLIFTLILKEIESWLLPWRRPR